MMDELFDIPINITLSREKGDRGLKGDRGAPGRTGFAGKDGRDGIDGKDGLNGINGKDGKDGLNGLDGKNGLNGRDGKDGKDGDIIDFNASINDDGELLILKSTGEELNIGKVKGNDGNHGQTWGYTNLTAISPLVLPEPHDFISLDIDALTQEAGYLTNLTGAITSTGNATVLGSFTAAALNTAVNDDNVAFLGTANTFTKAQSNAPVSVTSTSNSIATDSSLSNIFTHTLTENTTLANPTNLVSGTYYTWVFTQHASAAKTLAFGNLFVPMGTAFVITTTTSAKAVLTGLYDGTSILYTYAQA